MFGWDVEPIVDVAPAWRGISEGRGASNRVQFAVYKRGMIITEIFIWYASVFTARLYIPYIIVSEDKKSNTYYKQGGCHIVEWCDGELRTQDTNAFLWAMMARGATRSLRFRQRDDSFGSATRCSMRPRQLESPVESPSTFSVIPRDACPWSSTNPVYCGVRLAWCARHMKSCPRVSLDEYERFFMPSDWMKIVCSLSSFMAPLS